MVSKIDKKKKAKFKRLFSMGQDAMDRLDAMLVKKIPKAEIARTIQNEWGFFGDIKENTLIQQLKRYSDEALPLLDNFENIVPEQVLEGEVQEANPPSFGGSTKKGKLLADYKDEGDEYEVYQEMIGLARMQSARIDKLLKRENDLPVLMSGLGTEIRTHQGLLRDIAEFQFATGRLHKIPKSRIGDMTTELEKRARDAHEKAVKEQDKVSKASQKVLELLGSIENSDQEE